ncbi:MAG TPA: peroxiredoxin [Trueperaceae bacterium]|nr:peroxiredoxin [Trueperaceae bacterium]
MLDCGSEAPEFELEDQEGRRHRLSDYRGRWVVLYFYPKDDTPGCTKEACGFRDALPDLTGRNAVVLGMSADDRASHERFAGKHGLTFPLLVDPDKRVLEAYQAYGERSMYGRTFMGVKRITYLIDPDGKVARSWPKVQAAAHAAEVRGALVELGG